MPHTGPPQWQDPGDVSCDATPIPMIQKMQKTVEILQVQFIEKVVKKSEITQSKDMCQGSRRNGNSRKFTDRIVYVPVMLKSQCQPSAQVFDQVPTMQRSQSSQAPSATTRLTMSSHERQPTKRWRSA